jgi:hypothetical protein
MFNKISQDDKKFHEIYHRRRESTFLHQQCKEVVMIWRLIAQQPAWGLDDEREAGQ